MTPPERSGGGPERCFAKAIVVEGPEGLRDFEVCQDIGDLMDQLRNAPPAADSCLVSSYSSRGATGQKGGTLIDERVLDLAAHELRMKDPASFRPSECRCCGCDRLHLHDRRDRKLRLGGGGGFTVVTVVIFLCAKCSATWRVLPAFLARCLWRSWAVVAAAVGFSRRRADGPEVPERTRQRWCGRLAQAARVPMQVLASSGEAVLRGVAQSAGLERSRRALVDSFAAAFAAAAPLASLAELLHRLSPGIRLM